MVKDDAARLTRQAELLLDAAHEAFRVMLLGHRDVDPFAGPGIGGARDAEIVVGQVVLGAVLVVILGDRVEAHRDRQDGQVDFGAGLLGPFEVGLDPPSISGRFSCHSSGRLQPCGQLDYELACGESVRPLCARACIRACRRGHAFAVRIFARRAHV